MTSVAQSHETATAHPTADLRYLIELIEIVNRHTVEADLIRAAVGHLDQLGLAGEIVVRMLSDDGLRLELAESETSGEGIIRTLAAVPVDGSYEGHSLTTNTTFSVGSGERLGVQLDPDYLEEARRIRDAGANIANYFPLKATYRLGVISFHGYDSTPFDETRLELASRSARVIASGIEKCRLMAEAEAQRESLDRGTQLLTASNRELEDFAYVASHDLQEPLRKIQTFGDRLESRAADRLSEGQHVELTKMMAASQKMQTLIHDLLRYSRASSGAVETVPTELGPLVSRTIARSDWSDLGGELQLGELPAALVDPDMFVSVIEAIVANAATYHHPERTAVLRIDGFAADDETVTLTIGDNGIGFEPKYAERIFDPFFRLHGHDDYPGSGMGLAVCERLVARQSGTVSATSVLGEGATITVEFKAAPVDETTDHNHSTPTQEPN